VSSDTTTAKQGHQSRDTRNSRTLHKYSILYYFARRKNLKTATTCSGVGHRKDRDKGHDKVIDLSLSALISWFMKSIIRFLNTSNLQEIISSLLMINLHWV
jgi:hypothetical protein